jgi:hypothetical protein
MHKDKTQWRRTSLKLGEEEYKALLYISQKLDVSPTSYVEGARVAYDIDNEGYINNFTSYLKNKMVQYLLEEKQNDNK